MGHTLEGRSTVKRRPSGNCPKCGTWRYSLHWDHIVPRFKGGVDTPDNIQLLCANCHEDKTRLDFKGAEFLKENLKKAQAATRGVKRNQAFRDACSKTLRERYNAKFPGGRKADCHPERPYYIKGLCRQCDRKRRYVEGRG